MSDHQRRDADRSLRWHDIRLAVHDLWRDHGWPVKLTLALIVSASLWGMVVAGWPALDGDEHDTIAPALAFGYFTNFLVPALQLAQRHDRSLPVLRPTSIAELRRYTSELEPRLRQRFDHEWLPPGGRARANSLLCSHHAAPRALPPTPRGCPCSSDTSSSSPRPPPWS